MEKAKSLFFEKFKNRQILWWADTDKQNMRNEKRHFMTNYVKKFESLTKIMYVYSIHIFKFTYIWNTFKITNHHTNVGLKNKH